jgi:hypothetical protein
MMCVRIARTRWDVKDDDVNTMTTGGCVVEDEK